MMAPRRRKTTVLLVEDHEIMRQGLMHLINQEPDMTVCGEADSIAEARQAVKAQCPDVAVVDISLKDGNGTELIKDLQVRHPGVKVLVLSMHDESVYAERVLRAGAKGYVAKSEASSKVVEGIRRVVADEIFVSDEVTATMLSRFLDGASPGTSPIDRLTDRELEVFGLIGEGLQTREIAARLHLSAKTIETYRENIKRKLDLENATQMIVRAVKWVQSERDA